MTHREIHIDGRAQITPAPGPAPMLQWVPVDLLVIDDAYQRPLGRNNWVAIEKIAANFAWSRFHPLLVAPIAGGRFAVIDGQHRAHAAKLCGIPEVPAMAVMVGVEEQARAFAWVNSQSIRVSTFHIFKAALSAGDDWAVRADAAVSAAGCKLMTYHASSASKKPGEVYCVGVIRKAIAAGHDSAVTAALAAIVHTPTLGASAASFSDYLLNPWIGAVAAQPVRQVDVLAAALSLKRPFKLIEDAHRSLLSGGPTEKARKALMGVIAEAVRLRGVAA